MGCYSYHDDGRATCLKWFLRYLNVSASITFSFGYVSFRGLNLLEKNTNNNNGLPFFCSNYLRYVVLLFLFACPSGYSMKYGT